MHWMCANTGRSTDDRDVYCLPKAIMTHNAVCNKCLAGFPVSNAAARQRFYTASNWCYQVGVFISRSSGLAYQVRYLDTICPHIRVKPSVAASLPCSAALLPVCKLVHSAQVPCASLWLTRIQLGLITTTSQLDRDNSFQLVTHVCFPD